jgi:hypothetical protein
VNTSFDSPGIIRASLLFLGLVVALFIGILVGEANWIILSAIGAFILIAAVAQFAVRHLLTICLVLVTLDFSMAPAGFKIGPMEQIGIVAAFAWLLVCWRRNFNTLAPKGYMELKSWRFFQNVVLVSAAYAAAHFVYNMIDPYDELAFGWKGASKAYTQTFGAFLMVVLIARARLLYPVTANKSVTLLWLFLVGLIVATTIGTIRAIQFGTEHETGLSLEEKIDLHRLFVIPGINAHDNAFTLRQLGPAAVLIGSTFLFFRPTNLGPFLPTVTMFVGVFACFVSGGRASLVTSVAFLLAVMFRARRVVLAFTVVGVLLVSAALILVFPVSALKELPWHVQRSVGWFRPDLRTQATEGIQGSSDMRWRYFIFAWEHYTSGDARLILFGRSVGQMDSSDVMSFMLYNELAQMEFAVRRLTTHNGMADFLLGWGLFGYLLNVAMSLSCVVLMICYSLSFTRNTHGSCWAFIAAMFLLYWLIYTHVGGAFVWPLAIGLILVSLAQTEKATNIKYAVHIK